MQRALGYDRIQRFHMNEGHASLLTLELLDEEAKRAGRKSVTHSDLKAALNGVRSLSILDGWRIERCIEGVTEWSIENDEVYQGSSKEIFSKHKRITEKASFTSMQRTCDV